MMLWRPTTAASPAVEQVGQVLEDCCSVVVSRIYPDIVIISSLNVTLKGYTWQTNQIGLAIDTIVAYELVKPDGKVIKVTEESDPELFFGLKVIFLSSPFVD